MSNRLIFLHIPKAGGTTLSAILRRHFEKEEIFITNVLKHGLSAQDFYELSSKDKKGINFLTGHFFFGIHKAFTDSKQSDYLTFLRSPLKRIRSHYEFVKRTSNHPLNQLFLSKDLSIEDYCLNGYSKELDNGQVRLLANYDGEFGTCTNEHLELAKKNIEKSFPVVGILERFDESLIVTREKYKALKRIYYINERVGKYRSQNELSDKIKKLNQYDIQLYEWANAKLNIQINEIQDFNKKLNSFKRKNSLNSKLNFIHKMKVLRRNYLRKN